MSAHCVGTDGRIKRDSLKRAKLTLESQNRDALQCSGTSFEVETLKDVLGAFRAHTDGILEIGCGDGRKLEKMAAFFQVDSAGIDTFDRRGRGW